MLSSVLLYNQEQRSSFSIQPMWQIQDEVMQKLLEYLGDVLMSRRGPHTGPCQSASKAVQKKVLRRGEAYDRGATAGSSGTSAPFFSSPASPTARSRRTRRLPLPATPRDPRHAPIRRRSGLRPPQARVLCAWTPLLLASLRASRLETRRLRRFAGHRPATRARCR